MKEALQIEISEIVEQIKTPITKKPEKEVPELVADLVGAMDRLRMWEVKRGDWVSVP